MIIAYVNATLVTAQGIRRQALLVDTRQGHILPPGQPSDQRIDASGLYLYSGLINAHDHLTMNHYPRSRPRPRYQNAREWAADMSARLDSDPYRSLRRAPLKDQCLVGGLKNLFSGVTTVAHHDPFHAPLKSPHFPIRVLRHYGWAHSLYLTPARRIQRSYWWRWRGLWMIHLAEGIDAAAAEEYATLKALGCAGPKTLLVHGLRLPEEALRDCGGLVWCPSSNLYLFGESAQVMPWYAAGKLALGSDSRLTADGDLLAELKAAAATGQLDALALFHCVTDGAARLLRLPRQGDLAAGMWADVLALRPAEANADPYETLIQAQSSEVAWVMRRGRILWQQGASNANCHYAGQPYRLHPHLCQQLRTCTLPIPGLTLLPDPII